MENNKYVFVLVRTSNQGSDLIQCQSSNHKQLYQALAEELFHYTQKYRSPGALWSHIGIVVGAKHTTAALELRKTLPHSKFLVPGYGAQGGGTNEACMGAVKNNSSESGIIINSGRSICFPFQNLELSESSWIELISKALIDSSQEIESCLNSRNYQFS